MGNIESSYRRKKLTFSFGIDDEDEADDFGSVSKATTQKRADLMDLAEFPKPLVCQSSNMALEILCSIFRKLRPFEYFQELGRISIPHCHIGMAALAILVKLKIQKF